MGYDNDDSDDISVDEFIESLKKFDYIYFVELDNNFINKYSEALYDSSMLKNNTIHKIVEIDSKIRLE